MKIRYNITGAERKKLVLAVSGALNAPLNYLGAPTFAYEVGGVAIDKEGTLTGELTQELLGTLTGQGFAGTEVIEQAPAQDSVPAAPAQTDMTDIVCISLPKDGFTDTTLANLRRLVESKSALIKKAFEADELPIEETDDAISFPWVRVGTDAETMDAYTRFICALCDMVKSQKRVTSKEKPTDNEKYAFRCFLLRLGFIGAESKAARKILLRNLSGNGSFKSGQRKTETAESADAIHSESTEVGSDE